MSNAFANPAAPISSVAQESAATAALRDLSDSLSDAREKGRFVLELPLEQIDTDHLVRDRTHVDADDMASLVASLRLRGQQTPIEVSRIAPDRYGLISGWRRLAALKQLAGEAGGTEPTTVLALLRTPADASEAYVAMVEENEIRVGLSYYERARIVEKSVKEGVFDTEKAALNGLFHAASRAKRSKIKSFIRIVQPLDDVLTYPEALSERIGLSLSKALEDDATIDRVKTALHAAPPASADEELAIIQSVLSPALVARAKLEKTDTNPAQKAVSIVRNPDGSLALRGPGVTEKFRRALADWIAKS